MSERNERREGGGWRSWVGPVVASVCVVIGLSAVEAVSPTARLVVAAIIVAGGVGLLALQKKL